MKRLEKVDLKTVNDVSNGNRGEELRQNIFRNISKSFCINRIEIMDNSDFIYDGLRNCGTALDDDVFIEKEKEFSVIADHFNRTDSNSGSSSSPEKNGYMFEKTETSHSFSDDVSSKSESFYRCEKSMEEGKKEEGRIGRPRRASDVIDSVGDDCVNLRRSLESGGIAISTPRVRTSSDLGYSGSFTSSSPVTSSSFPPHVYNIQGGKRLNDEPDSKPFTNIHKEPNEGLEARMPVERDDEEYNMFHPRRGRAIIINNDTFDNNLANPRKGSDVDVENLSREFYNLGFEVTIFDNPTYSQIKEAIYEISQEDHSDADCLMMAVMTHGLDNGWLYARDSLYPVDALWLPFTADKCLTLAGKPKIFFVQACRGRKVDPGVTLVSRKPSVSETDAGTATYKLPSHADFLIAYSSPDGFYSWRNTEDGTWFIQSLVEELRRSGTKANFVNIMTSVNRRVALHFSSYNEEAPWLHEQKQVSIFQSTLLRDLIFRPKI